jgi:CIC family chloride channel protein
VGLWAVAFLFLLDLITRLVLEGLVGYHQPRPAGEGGYEGFTYPLYPLLLPFSVAVGGLLSGLLTFRFSPESAGVGTDSAIRAYHRGEGVSLKTSLVKLITSAITIGTGGTSGREGPIALIGAGVGSWVSDLFSLSAWERRTAIAVGLGSGVAAVFKAPLAGAIISAEVFFKKDFDAEAMIPSFVASVASYTVFCTFFGFQPIFSADVPESFRWDPLTILSYAGLGLLCALVVRLYVWFFFLVRDLFSSLRVPEYLKPALGGFLAGSVGAVLPVAVGNGYGWIQLFMDGVLRDPLLALGGALAVILGVSFTVGSGGSGGVFGPSVMIGGLLGAFYSITLNDLYGLDLNVPSFMIVGMVSLFGGAARAPLSTLILIAEMTGGYQLLVPAMVSVFVTYFLSGERSIFPSQVNTKLDSPAHMDRWGLYVLEKLKVKDYMSTEPVTVSPNATLDRVHTLMTERLIGGVPVVNDDRLVGIVTKSDLMKVREDRRRTTPVSEVMTRDVLTVPPEASLAEALRIMSSKGVGRLPVVSPEGKVVGIIARADIGRAIRKELR